MATIYKPSTNTDPTKAVYGESSAAVKALQTSLNTQNAGKTGYTPLAVDGKYGPLTQAATQYKAPGATDTTTPAPTPTDTGRYVRTTNPNDTAIADTTKKLNDYVGNQPSLDQITARNRELAQGQIDAITSEFNRLIDEQNVTNSGLNDRVRAMNVTSGLGGSDFATAAAVGQETKNKKAIDMINEQKMAKIAEALGAVDQRSQAEYQAQRQEYVKGLNDNLDRLKAAKEEDRARALDSVKALAEQGVTLEKLKAADPKSYDTLLKESGGSELDLASQWNESLPADKKVQYQDKIIQGPNGDAVLFRYGFDPMTGTVTNKEYPLGVSYNTLNDVKPINVNGRLFALSKDANGNEIARPLTDKISSSSSSTKGSVKSGAATFTRDQLSAVSSELEKSKTLYGGDGKYVNPDEYLKAYKAWTDPSVGGLAKDFLTYFPPAKYVNPANNTLPEYLRSANKTGPSAKQTSGRTM